MTELTVAISLHTFWNALQPLILFMLSNPIRLSRNRHNNPHQSHTTQISINAHAQRFCNCYSRAQARRSGLSHSSMATKCVCMTVGTLYLSFFRHARIHSDDTLTICLHYYQFILLTISLVMPNTTSAG